jgi:pimeloyl-ACP methyl ester carboxylesterase
MGRLGRLARLLIAAAVLAVLLVLLLLAGIYVFGLAHPVCNHSPAPLSKQPLPEEHWIQTNERRSLHIWYYPPRNGAVIVALGGWGGSLGDTLPPVGFLLEQGYGVVQVDQRGCSQPPAAVTLGAKEEQDIEAVIEFLESQSDVKTIGAFGFSMGGVTAIRAAARNLEIAAVVAEGGYYNLGDDFVETGSRLPLTERIFLYTVATIYWIYHGVNPWQVSPIDDLPKISPRPVFLIYGEKEVASGHALEQYQAASDPKKLWIVPGGAHGSNAEVAPAEYQAAILDFFNQNLLP